MEQNEKLFYYDMYQPFLWTTHNVSIKSVHSWLSLPMSFKSSRIFSGTTYIRPIFMGCLAYLLQWSREHWFIKPDAKQIDNRQYWNLLEQNNKTQVFFLWWTGFLTDFLPKVETQQYFQVRMWERPIISMSLCCQGNREPVILPATDGISECTCSVNFVTLEIALSGPLLI